MLCCVKISTANEKGPLCIAKHQNSNQHIQLKRPRLVYLVYLLVYLDNVTLTSDRLIYVVTGSVRIVLLTTMKGLVC